MRDVKGLMKGLVVWKVRVLAQLDFVEAGRVVEAGCCQLFHWVLQGKAGLEAVRRKQEESLLKLCSS